MADLPIPSQASLLDAAPRLSEPLPSFGRLDTPDGGWLRHARWEPAAEPRATLVLLNGRSEFIEKQDEAAHDWLARGFRIFTLDWRGQGLSSRFLSNPHKGHVPDFDLMLDDLDLFLNRVVLPEQVGPLVLFAHSMGGHIAARYIETHADRFAAAILSAPMAGFLTRNIPGWIVRFTASVMTTTGHGDDYAFGQKDYDPADHRFETNPVTQDPERWTVHHRWYRANPELSLGGVTWGWLAAAFASIDRLMRPGISAAGDLPVLVLSPGLDTVTPPRAHSALAHRYRNGRLVRFPDAKHELMMETDAIRNRAWAEIDDFLAEALSRQARPEPRRT